ncbi:MAG: hypothetical protein WD314_09315 [Trueperaceae bacterium]
MKDPTFAQGMLVVGYDDCYASGLTEVMFAHDDFLSVDDFYRVDYQFDDWQPQSSVWQASLDYEYLFLPDEELTWFLAALRTDSQLTIQDWDSYGTALPYTFELRGARKALRQLHCEV